MLRTNIKSKQHRADSTIYLQKKFYWMSVYMNDIAAAGGIEEIKKGIRNCAKMEKQKKMRYGLNKTKYMTIKTGKEREKR